MDIVEEAAAKEKACPVCGKTLLNPKLNFCPDCGSPTLSDGHPLSNEAHFRLPKGLYLLSPFCFSLSLFLPAIYCGGDQTFHGLSLLLFGALGAQDQDFQWYANPLLLVIYPSIFWEKYRAVLILSGIAFLITLTTFALDSMPSEAHGSSVSVQGLGPGFYLWSAAFLVPLVLSAITVIEEAARKKEPGRTPKLL